MHQISDGLQNTSGLHPKLKAVDVWTKATKRAQSPELTLMQNAQLPGIRDRVPDLEGRYSRVCIPSANRSCGISSVTPLTHFLNNIEDFLRLDEQLLNIFDRGNYALHGTSTYGAIPLRPGEKSGINGSYTWTFCRIDAGGGNEWQSPKSSHRLTRR